MFFRGGTAAEHAGDFGNASFPVQKTDGTDGVFIGCPFFHREMAVGARRHLGKMGDAENLFVLSQLIQFACNDHGGFSADVCVDFIENDGADIVHFRKYGFDCA